MELVIPQAPSSSHPELREQSSSSQGIHSYEQPSKSDPQAPEYPGMLPSGMASEGLRRLSPELPQMRLLVVDDDAPLRKACAEIASGMGFIVTTASNVTEALEQMKRQPADVLLLDLKLPGGGGLKLLNEVHELYPATAVVVMTAFATVSSAVEAMRTGASDYLTKPFSLEDLTSVLEEASRRVEFDLESRRLRERLKTSRGMGELIGISPGMEKVYRILSKVAFSAHPVLILGESGTGKELVARSIHTSGPNASKPFVTVDCGSLVPTLIESELFGHVKGAFTGANRTKEGLLSSAGGGTVFLDEIGELPLDLQSKLLRALQEKEVRPVGATRPVSICARVLAATNRDLNAMVAQGQFRKDLYFRLNVVNLRIPPLRERREDIPLLSEFFLEGVHRETGRRYSLSDDALRLMMDYDWPGNVRELEHCILRTCAISSGPVLHTIDLPTQLQDYRAHLREAQLAERTSASAHNEGPPAIISIAEMEKQAILGTIRQLNGDKLMAARLLGIGKTTLYRKLKEYGLNEGGEADEPGGD
ncbi:MAG TPA: sigma-54 dependent transcriptional regulator [Acidobacteriaceae bacterium]|nr:sigma-54 dependent transcriptional regulator [Acidobacteriaceae bacterium]